MRKIIHILVHHTATAGTKTTLAGVDGAHKVRNWGTKAKPVYAAKSSLGYYTQYHYFIDWKGKLTQARTDDEIGWHGNASNPHSIGICLAGRFDKGFDKQPSEAQVKTLAPLLKDLAVKYKIKPDNIVPHRKFAPYKSCYGNNLADDWARNLIGKKPIPYLPYFEKKNGEPAIYAYDSETDKLIPFTSGRLFKLLFGGYDKVKIEKVKELSRNVADEEITLT